MKRHGKGKRSPSGGRNGHKRPTRFEEHKGFLRARKALGKSGQIKLAAQLRSFKKEWIDPDVSLEELKRTWEYKALKGEAKKWGVMQIRMTDHRVALVLVSGANSCVWFLHVYRRSGKNQEDINVAVQRAKGIVEGG